MCFPVFSQQQELIITEIFADPSPTKGLPDKEYLEIYNATSKDISVKGYKLLYSNFSALFPDSILKTNTYYIVCKKENEAEFRSFGKVIPLQNLSLNNDGSLLILKNDKGKDLFFVDYKSNWFNPLSDGGISLEMIDVNFSCLGQLNWAASTALLGGTPGKINSVSRTAPEITPPKFLNFNLTQKELVLNFDENLAIDYISDKNNFKITEGDLEIVAVTYNLYKPNQVIIQLNKSTEVGEGQKLLIILPRDCSGNVGENVEVDFSNLLPAEKGDILLSEVLFNPKVGGDDFVEIYNISDKVINLKNWKLGRVDNKNEIADLKDLAGFVLHIKPKQYMAFTSKKAFLTANYPSSGLIVEVSALPSYNNDQGQVLLFDPNSVEFDRFSYNEKMHNPMIIDVDGVSLERVAFKSATDSWLSASSDAGFATPGLENSQRITDELKSSFYAEPLIFNPNLPNSNSSTFLKYNLIVPSVSATIEVLDKNGKSVRKLTNNAILGSKGEIEWDGKGNSGDLMPVGYYVFKIAVYSEKINEVFFAKCVLASN